MTEMTDAHNPLYQQIEKIRRQYEAIQGESAPLMTIEHLLSNVSDSLYSSEYRFVLELLQNAVDSYRTENGRPLPVHVRFELTPDMLVVSNDGAPFSERDIARICGLVRERKVKKIGYKGIGFKSVASITDNAQIYSLGCQFEFNKRYHPDYEYVWLAIPHWIPEQKIPAFIDRRRVSFVLPFHDRAKTGNLFEEFSNILNPRTGALLLFLDHLGQLELAHPASGQSFSMRKRFDPASGLTIIEQQDQAGRWRQLGRWLVTSYQPQGITPAAEEDYIKRRGLRNRQTAGEPLDLGDTRISLAFHLDDDNRFVRKKGPLYAYFPVHQQSSGFYFTIQADFLTTLSREALAIPSPWNDWLIENIPAAIEASLEQIKQLPAYHSIIYEALPLQDSQAIEKPFKEAVRNLYKRLRNLPIVLTDLPRARWIKPGEAVWLAPGLRRLLTNLDLRQLKPGKRAFVSFELTGETAKTFLTSKQGLAVEEMAEVELLGLLGRTDWLAGKSPEWFADLFEFLAGQIPAGQARRQVGHLALVPTTAGLLARPGDPALFLPAAECPAVVSGTKLVHPALLARPQVAAFLTEAVQLQPVSVVKQIENVILPGLAETRPGLDPELLAEYVTFIKDHYYQQAAPVEWSRALDAKLKNLLLLPTAGGAWQPARSLCLAEDERGRSTPAGYSLAGAPADIFVRSPEDRLTADFYRWAGVQVEPPPDILAELLAGGDWFVDKPAEWFQALYEYLGERLPDQKRLHGLPIVPVSQPGGKVRLYPPAELFLPPPELETELLDGLAGAEVTFVDPHFFPQPQQAQRLLARLGVAEFGPLRVIERLVISRFEQSARTGSYDEASLLSYTALALETFGQRRFDPAARQLFARFKEAVRLKTTVGCWGSPAELYLTASYGAHDLEKLLAGLEPAAFVSDDYLELLPEPARWAEFLTELGVSNRLAVTVTETPLEVAELARRQPHLEPYLKSIINDGVEMAWPDPGPHYLYNHAALDRLAEIIDSQEEGRLTILLNLLADFWSGPGGYEQFITAAYEKPPAPPRQKPSWLAWLLQHQPVLPTSRGFVTPAAGPVYRDIPEIRQLVGDEVAYLNFEPQPRQRRFFEGFLGLIWQPEEVPVEAVKAHLRQLKTTESATPEQCAPIYSFLAAQGETEFLAQEPLTHIETRQAAPPGPLAPPPDAGLPAGLDLPVAPEEAQVKGKAPLLLTPAPGSGQLKEAGIDYGSEGEKIGRWGERYAYRWLKESFSEKYPQAELQETELGFKVSLAGQILVDVQWFNKKAESMEKIDLRMVEDGLETYWEIKSSRSPDPDQSFKMSQQEWDFAREQGDRFHILRVLGAGGSNPDLIILQNPYKLWQQGRLRLEPVAIRIDMTG